jgi:hypothetical protein
MQRKAFRWRDHAPGGHSLAGFSEGFFSVAHVARWALADFNFAFPKEAG